MTDYKLEQQYRCIKCNVELIEDHEGNLVHPEATCPNGNKRYFAPKKLISLTEAS